MIIACWIAWGVLWLVMALFVKRTVEQPDSVWRITVGLVGAAMFLTLRTQTHPTARQLEWQHTAVVGVVTSILVAGGLAFSAWARLVIGGNWSGGIVLKEDHELVQSGPYAIVRHPIYTGLIAMVFGTAAYYAEPLVIGLAIVLAAVLYAKSKREERLMVEHFPDVYPEYRRRVRAIVPYVF